MLPKLASSPSSDTDAFRVYTGERYAIESYVGHWLVQTRDLDFPEWIHEQDEPQSVWWKQLEQEDREAPSQVSGQPFNSPLVVREHGAKYEVDFQAGYSQGIFLDQRLNRQKVRNRVQPGDRVLNTFAYTCAFSVAAALGGAVSTSVDLSKNYLEWGKRNFGHNDLEPTSQYFTRGDTFDWLRRWKKSGVRFDGVILDPPTFSRNEKGNVFRVEKHYGELLQLALAILNPNGWMLACTNYRGFSPTGFENVIVESIGHKTTDIESLEMPPEFQPEDYLKSFWIET
tara:strand:- start:19729 stop:20583 length:855 start_codon:yes stop_codon:yes gene_type:complete